jgi:bifunctional non-homologous end joining protein LigD
MADRILPHIVGRPLSIVRCPDGLDPGAAIHGIHQTFRGPRLTKCFFQKHTSRGTSGFIRSVRAPEQGKMADYLAVDDAKGLVMLVQFGTLELHPWGSRADKPDLPDRMFFDLDPGPSLGWNAVVEAARIIKELLDKAGLRSFAKTTGGKGLHVVVPLQRRNTWDEIKAFSLAVAARLVEENPEKYVFTMTKSARGGKIFIDDLRNARGSTAVAPYSTRARPGAPVSTPVEWSELDDVGPDSFDVRNLERRLRALKRDPWEGFLECRQVISRATSAGLEQEVRRHLGRLTKSRRQVSLAR